MQGVEPAAFLIHKIKAKGVKLWKRTKNNNGRSRLLQKVWLLSGACCSGSDRYAAKPGRTFRSRPENDRHHGFFGHSLGDNGDLVPGVSAGVIMTLMALLIGFAPNPETGKLFGTAAGLGIGLKGFASTAFCLVAAAMFLAVAMTKTGLDKRIALVILSKLGAKSNRVVIGVILCGFILSFFVPSTTARVACLVPIVMGMIKAFDVPLKSKFAGMLMITVAQVDSVWNVGIKTAAAQNMVAVNFISSQLGVDISWLDWFVAAAPFSLLMSICLYKLMMHLMPPEIDEIKGGKETVARLLKEMGKVSVDEMKLLVISIFLLIFWTTEKKLHPIDTSTTTMVAVTLLLLPKIGVMSWNDVVHKVNWGTVLLFGVGISLGTALLSTKAATWMANEIVVGFGLENSTTIMVLAIMSLFLIVIHMALPVRQALLQRSYLSSFPFCSILRPLASTSSV